MKTKMFLLKVFIIIFLLIPAFAFGQTSPQIVNFTTDDGLAHNKVKAIVIDAEGNKWFGTDDGVSKFNGTIWATYTTSDGLVHNKVKAIAIDAEGNKWFGTDNGVSRFDGTTWITYNKDNGLADNHIKAIAIDAEGNKWFGTDDGVSKFDGTTWATYTKDDGLANNKVWAIAIDVEGNKWFGTDEGVSRFDGTTWSSYTTADGLVEKHVRSIAIDKEGNKWFGTDGGVSNFNGTTWTSYATADGLVERHVRSIAIDLSESIWFGTDNGVSKFDGTIWTTYTTSDGLAHNNVKAIAIDDAGNKWFGTDGGASKFVTPLPQPEINVTPDSLDFGTLSIGSSELRSLTVTNTGDQSLDIYNIVIDHTEFQLRSPTSYVLMPDSSFQIDIEYLPTSIGLKNSQLIIESNASNQVEFIVKLMGTGVAPAITADSMHIASVIGATEFWVYGSGFDSTYVTGMDVSTDPVFNTINYEFTVPELIINSDNITGTKQININTIAAGDYYARVHAPGGPYVTPLYIFSGYGPEIDVLPLELNFPNVTVGGSNSLLMWVYNSGETQLDVTNITFNIPFTVTPTHYLSIAPNDSAAFTVTFQPTESGSYIDTLFISSNDPEEPVVKAIVNANAEIFPPDDGETIEGSSTTWAVFTIADGLSHNKVKAIVIDAEGNKWFGTDDGVSKFDGTIWTNYTTGDGLVHNKVKAIAIDDAGNKWFGTDDGVSKFNGTAWMTYTTDDGLVNNRVKAIAIDSEGNKWFATEGGVSKFYGTTWTTYTTDDGLVLNKVRAIAIDAEGNKWFGTEGGVSKFDGTTWTTYNTDNGLVLCKVRAITIDSEGNKWFGTEEGVSKFDGTTWTTYTIDDGLAHNKVKPIAIDAEGNKWFGTDGGVSKFDGTTWTTYTKDEGLVHNNVKAIAIDAEGNKWFGTDDGVSKFVTSPLMVDNLTPPVINIIPNSLNFQSVTVGNSDSLVLWIYNTGDDSLEITEIKTKRPFSVSPDEYTLEPSDSVQVTVIFHPKKKRSFSEKLKIHSNDLDNQVIEIELKGNGVAPLQTIEGPVELSVDSDRMTIFWKTNRVSSSTVEYGTSTDLSQATTLSDLSINHKVSLTDLSPGTKYYYRARSSGMDNREIVSEIFSVNTLAVPDTLPPVIIAGPIANFIESNKAAIWWQTDKISSSRVDYGVNSLNLDMFEKANESDGVKEHLVQLTGLQAEKTYFYRVSSIAENGSMSASGLSYFTTTAVPDTTPPHIITGPDPTSIRNTSVTIEWTTDELSTSVLHYWLYSSDDPNPTEMVWLNDEAAGVNHHKAVLTGLTPGAEYFYYIINQDISARLNKSVSKTKHFTTNVALDNNPPVLIAGPIVDPTDKTATFEWETDKASDSFVYIRMIDLSGFPIEQNFRKIGNASKVKLHIITVTNLKAGTRYEYKLTSRDFDGNLFSWPTAFIGVGFSAAFTLGKTAQPPGGGGTFFTDQEPDTQQPIILEGPTVVAKTANSITIQWKTDERSNSFVNYGLTTAYGLIKGDAINVTAHNIILTNLTSSTLYNFNVSSTDASNNGPTLSGNAVVSTEAEADNTPPRITAGPVVESITDDQATIIWETDEIADTYVEYGLITDYGNVRISTEHVKIHVLTLTNLTASTEYHFRVASTDISDNGPTMSADLTFTTANAPDVTPPVITEVNAAVVTDRSATITYKTNELGDTFVNYGLTPSFGFTVGSTQDVLNHEITLTNLQPDTTYYYRVGSIDKSGNETILDVVQSFKTHATPDTLPPAVPSGLKVESGNNQLLLMWNMNSEADFAGYNIFRNSGAGFQIIETNVADTLFYDTGLTNGMEYQYKLTAVDNSNNVSDESAVVNNIPAAENSPTSPTLLYPINGECVDNSEVILYVLNSIKPKDRDKLRYEFIEAEEPDFINQVACADNIQEGEQYTAWNSAVTLTNNKTYYWKVRAFDGYFYSDWSEPDHFVVNSQIVTGIELVDFHGEENDGIVLLVWETSSNNNAAGFDLYRSLMRDKGYTKITSETIESGKKNFSYTDETVEAGYTYYYKLATLSNSGITREFDPIEVEVKTPRTHELHQNYPNPFNPATTIRYELARQVRVRIKIYNLLGQEIKDLFDGHKNAGYQVIQWDGTDSLGNPVATGIYIYRIIAGEFTRAKKMMLIR